MGFLVRRSRERAKQNSAEALSHSGRRKEPEPARDSRLVPREGGGVVGVADKDSKLLHKDCTSTLHKHETETLRYKIKCKKNQHFNTNKKKQSW
jgi:hypothetical protein